MGSDPKPPKTDKVPRSEVHEKLLEEALRTPEEEAESYESGKWIAESPAPDELPRFIRARLDQAGIKDLCGAAHGGGVRPASPLLLSPTTGPCVRGSSPRAAADEQARSRRRIRRALRKTEVRNRKENGR